jgi:actin-related protein
VGIGESAFNSIQSCGVAQRKGLYANVILTGGSSMYQGIAARMTKELTSRAPADSHVQVIASPQRRYSAWTGGTILASLSSFEQMCIAREEYLESGKALVHSKCHV